jgi:hypothetical protein
MRTCIVLALAAALLPFGGCKGKKAKFAAAPAGKLKAFGEPGELGIGADTFEAQATDLEGKYLLYAIYRDPKPGWGFGHGLQLYNYNTELKIKLPLGKLGRSRRFGFIYKEEEPMIAVIRTVDTSGDGDVDEKDANQLFIMAPDGLDEEPVSTAGDHVAEFWADPKGELLFYAVSDTWEGKPVEEGEEEPEGDPVMRAFSWNVETKETNKVGECLRFYGISPDGKQTACLPADGVDVEKGEISVELSSRDRSEHGTVTLPTTVDQQVVPLGEGRVAYTRTESSSTGKRDVLYVRTTDGEDVQVTSPSVDTRILSVLGDGGLLFESRAIYTVDDKTVYRAVSGDLKKVYDLLEVEGTRPLEMPIMAGNGGLLSYAVFPETSFEAVPEATLMVALPESRPESHAVSEVANEAIAGLGETIVEKLRNALGTTSPVDADSITVSVPRERAVMPLDLEGEVTDESLMDAVVSVRDEVSGVLAEKGYDAVFVAEGHPDAVGVVKWHEEFGRHLSYLVAYGHWVPVREEYPLVVEDLVFKKMGGCADPRMVQLHAAGWLAAVRRVDAEELKLVVRADPIDPNMKLREGAQVIEAVQPGDEAVSFDVIADKVDPRRSHRSHFDLWIFADGERVPYFDAAWTEATKAWIEVLRGLPGEVLPTEKLEVFAMGNETIEPLAKWFPSTVVRQEEHLDVHLFLDDTSPPAGEKAQWDALADGLMEHFTPFLEQYDPDNVKKLRVSLYRGPSLVTEAWHMTPEEKYTHGCEHGDGESCYELALIYEQREKEMSAEMAFYEACDLGWEPACERISGAGAKKGGADEAGAKEDEEPGPPAKKSTLPPEVGAAVREAPSLKKSEIQAAIKEQMPKIKSCFTKQSVESGNVSVRITIDGKGEVTGSSVKHSSVDDEAVTKCLLMQVDMIEFPATPDGEPFTFSYPFTYMK